MSVASTMAGLTATTPEPMPSLASPASPARARVVAAVLVVAAVASAAFGIWHPAPGGGESFGYDVIAPIHTSWWAWHLFAGLGVAAGAIAVGLAVCLLVPARGATWATLGALLTSVGGLAFYGGVAAEGVLGMYATDPEALPAESGTTLITFVDDNFEPVGLALIPGLVLLAVGPLLLALALWRARSVPRWLPVAFALTNVAGFPLSTGVLAVLADGAFAATHVAMGWSLWHHTRTNTPRSNP
ncbi:MAG TPA: hypothetical protein VE623_01855 [Acidimicrobiales bacterium]|nr:hypothetical protein [Acidimicrobiales bacterium]